ncbi:Ger(x)C family spore germination protein [Niallia nealsonii]|uniref:Ger(X)C family spore germination protein n=1 Tax=Niallia nealsonii TaxID=115979 RepID=A0A2N0Z6G9_9BACI|nr:Ger(x)C family spore germination protein [Niallia nealsonii]PKG25087.1 Ger(x)C family spore germination protein [Niallia nealsonii]
MRRKFLLLLIISSCLLLCGCWDRKELSEVQLVAGMAVDLGEDAKYKITVEGLNAIELNSQTASGNAPSTVESIEGDSLAEITHQFNRYLPQSLIYSHMKVLVISEEAAKLGMLDFLDYVERNRELRDDFKILIAKGKAEDILKITYPFKKASSLKISPQVDNLLGEWGGDPGVRINDFISDLTLEGKSAVLAAVKVNGDPEKGRTMENITKVVPDAIVEIESLGVFKGDKLKGFMDLEATRSYLWITNQLKQTAINIHCEGDQYSAIRILQSNTNVDVKWENGKPDIHVKIKSEGLLEGTQCYKTVDSVKTYRKYEKLVNTTAAKEIKNTIQKAQKEFGSDIFGFGEIFRRQHNQQFMKVKDNWNNYFAEAKVKVDYDITIRRSGIRTESFLTKTKEER